MGLPMAVSLSKFHPVLCFDLSDQSMKLAQNQALATADSVGEVASSCDTIVTMLPSDAAVHSVMPTILDQCPKNTLVLDCSTVSPSTSRHWHAQLELLSGHSFVDAPVSGGVKGAQNASLTFMVGCHQDVEPVVFQRVHSILECMGERIIPCGGPGAGAATKLCNNLALAAQMAGVCEAMNLGQALGVDPKVLASVMNTSTAKCWASEVNNPHPLVAKETNAPASNEYEGGFGSRLMLKDLTLAVDAGKKEHVALPIGAATKELYQLVELRGMGGQDFGVLLQFLQGK